MKHGSGRGKSLSTLALYFLLLIALSVTAPAQPKLVPAPENFKVVTHPDCPVLLKLAGIHVSQSNHQMFSYSLKNLADKEIRAISISGLPGITDKNYITHGGLLLFHGGKLSGAEHNFFAGQISRSEMDSEVIISVDFVLFRDGSRWGPDTLGRSDLAIGLFEGKRHTVSKLRTLVDQMAEDDIRELITRQPYSPAQYVLEQGNAKWQEGFRRGYGYVLITLHTELKNHKNLAWIATKITDMENDLAPERTASSGFKRVSRNFFGVEPPVRILGFSIGNKEYEFNKDFVGNAYWLKDISFRIENNARKSLKYINLRLEFPETALRGNMMMSYLTYGDRPLPANITVKPRNDPPILPNTSFELALEDGKFMLLNQFLESRQPMYELNRLNVAISMVLFEDGTGWSAASSYIKEDVENPGRFIPLTAEEFQNAQLDQ